MPIENWNVTLIVNKDSHVIRSGGVTYINNATVIANNSGTLLYGENDHLELTNSHIKGIKTFEGKMGSCYFINNTFENINLLDSIKDNAFINNTLY